MNTRTNLTLGKEAVQKLMDGVNIAVDAIKPTYGPSGLNAVIEHELNPGHQVANDAQTIVQALESFDPVEKRGLGFMKELMTKQNDTSGDGRKTTALIASSILEQGFNSDIKPIELKKGLDELIPVIEKILDEQKQTITEKEVEKVATIAGESKQIGKLLGEIYERIGKDGIIIPEGSGTYETSYNIIEGVRFVDTGYLSPFMCYDEQARKEGKKETKAVYNNPTILVTKRKISHLNDINPLLETLTRQGKKDLVIFTDDMDSGVASILVKAHQDKIINCLVIKAPTLWKPYVFEDFAKVTGSTIVEDSTGLTFKNLELRHLGTCAKIEVNKDETVIVGGSDISDHIAELRAEGSNDSKLRLSWLTTKTAILKLGANSESELSHLRLKCNDAINASKLALNGGVVAGGGIALLQASKKLPTSVIGNMLKTALEAPAKQIWKNSGQEILDYGSNVLDACAVTKLAVRNAIGLASIVLTTGLVINFPPKSTEQLMQEKLQGKGMMF